jgi:hypothetical protein
LPQDFSPAALALCCTYETFDDRLEQSVVGRLLVRRQDFVECTGHLELFEKLLEVADLPAPRHACR